MDSLDLSSLALAPPSPKRDRARKSIFAADLKRHIGIKIGPAKVRNHSAPPRGSRERGKPTLACPFHKHDPLKFNDKDYQSCATKLWPSISRLKKHIFGKHTDQFLCSGCNRRFDSQHDLQSHFKEIKLCGLDPQPRLPKDIASATLLALRKTRESHKPQTTEEEWQDIYKLLFPDDARTVSPHFEFSTDQSDHVSESSVSRDSYDAAPSMTTAPTISSEVQLVFNQAHTSTYLGDLPERPVDQEAEVLERGIQTPQAPVTKDISLRIQALEDSFNFLMDRYLEDDKIPLPGDASPLPRETRSLAMPSLPRGDDFDVEPSPSNSTESPSSTSEQSTELCEDETQFRDVNGIDFSSTYLSLDPVKRALFDNSTRQFWSFYNELSISDWSVLWSKHATYTGAASSSQGTQRSRSTRTRTPSECPSHTGSLLTPKRKKRDDEDETNNNGNPSKRSNRILLQKEGLNLACPFHKYKPWKYNHGILRFRTCSTTPFDAIFRLKEHLRRVHPPPLHCTRCWLSFADQNSLVSHGQADIPCQRKQPVSVEGWTTEMDKNVTKRKDETERERWERIYRELFGRTLTNVPSPYFVPYDLAAAKEADLEALLYQEVPRIVLNSLSEQVNNMDIPDAARALFDPTAPYFQFENLIGNAIREAFTTYRLATATANNPIAPPTPQSSSANLSIAGDSSAAQSTSCECTTMDLSQTSRRRLWTFESLPGPLMSLGITQRWNNTMHPTETGEPSNSGRIHEQLPPPATELAPHTSETALNSFPQSHPGHLKSAEEYIHQGAHDDITSAHGASMDEYMYEFGLPEDFDNDAFLNMPSDPYSAPACS